MPKIHRVYIAGPLFNPSEQSENLQMDTILKKTGYQTFLPQKDGFLYVDMIKELQRQGCSQEEADRIALKLIFHLDVFQVNEGCDATVFNMNGRVPDEGAVAEAAMSYRGERPVVLYKSDARSLINGKDNPIIAGQTRFSIVTSMEQVPEELKRLESVAESEYARTMRIARLIFTEHDSRDGLPHLIVLARKYL